MDNITVGAFTASLNAKIGEHGGDEIESIEPSGNGYLILAKTHNDESVNILIDPQNTETAVHDAIGEEISSYSIMENIAYMTLVAGRLMINRAIPEVPRPLLIPAIIQIAETFELEHGSDMVGNDTVEAINKYAEEKLTEQFRK